MKSVRCLLLAALFLQIYGGDSFTLKPSSPDDSKISMGTQEDAINLLNQGVTASFIGKFSEMNIATLMAALNDKINTYNMWDRGLEINEFIIAPYEDALLLFALKKEKAKEQETFSDFKCNEVTSSKPSSNGNSRVASTSEVPSNVDTVAPIAVTHSLTSSPDLRDAVTQTSPAAQPHKRSPSSEIEMLPTLEVSYTEEELHNTTTESQVDASTKAASCELSPGVPCKSGEIVCLNVSDAFVDKFREYLLGNQEYVQIVSLQ